MEEARHSVDDRTFRVNFSGDGVARLQESVKEKLKEFMGDYTDDTLVEYVIVLLKNGRLKEEAKSELNVFLGDDSDSFVSWLWDHLTQNLHLYVKSNESLPEADNRNFITNDSFGKPTADMSQTGDYSHIDSEHEGEKLVHVSRNRRNREWQGLSEMAESFPLRSTVHDALHSREKTSRRPDAMHSSPPRPQGRMKRGREDERQPTTRDADSHPKHAPSRRLLEFAVRDAVKPAHQFNTLVEPSIKRLRSIVSTSVETVSLERLQKPRSTLRIPSIASVALKAAAKSSEDVIKSRNAGSVFDRLGHGIGPVEPSDQSSILKRSILQDIKEDEEFDQSSRTPQENYNQKIVYDGDFTGNNSTVNRVTDMDVDSTSDNEGYDDFGISSHHGYDSSQYAYSNDKRQSSLMLHYNASNNDTVVKKANLIQQGVPTAASSKPSSKIVNISVNVNTWKPTNFQAPRGANEIENQMVNNSEQATVKPNTQLSKEYSGNDKETASTDIKKDLNQKSHISTTPGISYTTNRPSEDIESRTIFVTNVHFAATKDTLSRHFNKFGEVLKVIIMTDPVSRQPIGSAYVEFLRKESAELALSLNGTSFMSRILKVVLRNSVESHAVGWPQIARSPPFTPNLGRMPFPRGILPGAFRARPLKPGARSLQWKRGMPAPQNATGTSRSLPQAISGRNLTYVRPEKT